MPRKQKIEFTEFECPECDAHNPWDDGFGYGDEVFCSWCGSRFRVRPVDSEEPKFKLRSE